MSTHSLDVSKHSEKATTLLRDLKIVGQPEAVDALTNAMDKFDSGLYPRTRPIHNMLFLGPTGSGKTYAVECFVECLFGDPKKMFKIDCGEFQHSHEIAKLIGSPPGYLGHRETHALLTNEKIQAMQKDTHPFSVILFDEIEKASDGLWNLLLGILDKGVLTLGTNEAVDLTSCIIIMTSNVGSKELAAKVGNDVLGFLNPTIENIETKELRETAFAAARRKFMPEFMNRINETVMFNSLTPDNLREILNLELDKLQSLVIQNCVKKPWISLSPSAKKQLLAEGYDPKYGARHLNRVIEKHVMLPVSRAAASKQVEDLDRVIIDYDEGKFCYFVEPNL